MRATPHFIIIDDDSVNNIICTKLIQKAFPGTTIQTFTDPEKGLRYIQVAYAEHGAESSILFLDINMPSLTGWDVLSKLKTFASSIRDLITVFMLSSSINSSDKDRANNHPLVSGYVSKPLSVAEVIAICHDKNINTV